MYSAAVKFAKFLRLSAPAKHTSSSSVVVVQQSLRQWCSTTSFNSDNDNDKHDKVDDTSFNIDNDEEKHDKVDDGNDEFLNVKPGLRLQGVDPKMGWGFRGVHKAIICGKVGQAPVQKILRNGRTVTIFTVGTGGMFDQRTVGGKDLPKPAQWHRIAVHNELLGTYAVKQLAKNSSVYVEGDIETRVYNDSISGEVKNIPEICVRQGGRIHLIKSGENVSSISFDDLREGLLS